MGGDGVAARLGGASRWIQGRSLWELGGALGLLLFVITLILNIIALHVVRKYREQYE